MQKVVYCLSLILIAALAGCSSSHHQGSEDAEEKRGPATMIYSPNGEPLNGNSLGRPTCMEAMARWFDRMDAAHTGSIGRSVFMADAETQFRRMDIDNNGYLVSGELERFRLPYRQEAGASALTPAEQHGRTRNDYGGSTASTGHDDRPDPVMSADTNNDFRVTHEEFMTQAGQVFTALDTGHNSALSRNEIQETCDRK